MGYFAITVLALLVLGEAFVIYALLNRLLIQAKLPPIEAPLITPEREVFEPAPRQPKFRVPFLS